MAIGKKQEDEIFEEYYNKFYPCLSCNETENKILRDKHRFDINNLSREEKDLLKKTTHYLLYLNRLAWANLRQEFKNILPKKGFVKVLYLFFWYSGLIYFFFLIMGL